LLLAVLPASTRPAVRYIDCDGRYAGLTLRFPSKYVARTIADRLAREMPRLRGAVFDLAGNVLITFGGDTICRIRPLRLRRYLRGRRQSKPNSVLDPNRDHATPDALDRAANRARRNQS
jgi:hypothetical protein